MSCQPLLSAKNSRSKLGLKWDTRSRRADYLKVTMRSCERAEDIFLLLLFLLAKFQNEATTKEKKCGQVIILSLVWMNWVPLSLSGNTLLFNDGGLEGSKVKCEG